MKLLLDENLPHDLRHLLTGHDAFTVAFMGWQGLENGALLARAADEGIEAMLTMDAGIAYEQSLQRLPVSVVLLRAASNAMDDLRPLVPQLLEALRSLPVKTLVRIG